jgi:hypothetical protein
LYGPVEDNASEPHEANAERTLEELVDEWRDSDETR